jgi:integrase
VALEQDLQKFRERMVGRSVTEDTFAEYERWIGRFESWYDGSDPGLAALEDFDSLLALPERSRYPWSNPPGPSAPDSYAYRTRIIALSAVKQWVRRHYGTRIPEQPSDIALGEEEEFDPTYLDRDRVEEIIEEASEACNCEGCSVALQVSYDAVLRAAELARLTYGDIEIPPGEPVEDAAVDVTAVKGSRDTKIEVSQSTAEALAEHMDSGAAPGDPLFTNTYGDGWNRNSWASHVRRYHCESGSHSWGRHTPILHMLESGVDVGTVYRRARHVNVKTTAKYARYVGRGVPGWLGGSTPDRRPDG